MPFTVKVMETHQDSGFSGSFDISCSLINSTPLTHNVTRKRKYDESLDSCPSSPQLSSTHFNNESLLTRFKDIQLGHSICNSVSVPNTPKKQIISREFGSAENQTASPLEESRKILYSSGLKTRSATKRLCLSPSPWKKVKCQNETSSTEILLKKIITNPTITRLIFKNLSGGNLYRLSKVSSCFARAIEADREAYRRLEFHREVYRENKENYSMPTPPSSPEKCDSPPRSNSENFNMFFKSGRALNRSQSQIPCPKCSKPCMVENNIGQCGNFAICGYIHCLKCLSFSETGPQNFKDSCGGSILRNVSNRVVKEESIYSNSFSFTYQDSGFYSEIESSPVKEVVRRKLFTSTETPKAFAAHNSQLILRKEKRQEKKNFAKVIANTSNKRSMKYESPPNSPPKGDYVACSKRSKKNLKRLTF